MNRQSAFLITVRSLVFIFKVTIKGYQITSRATEKHDYHPKDTSADIGLILVHKSHQKSSQIMFKEH
jgi:hypothetical protein